MTSKPTGSVFLYIRVEVMPADPGRVALMHGLLEDIGDPPAADTIPHTDPGSISFDHVELVALDEADAYRRGWTLLDPPRKGAVCNDYVVQLEKPNVDL